MQSQKFSLFVWESRLIFVLNVFEAGNSWTIKLYDLVLTDFVVMLQSHFHIRWKSNLFWGGLNKLISHQWLVGLVVNLWLQVLLWKLTIPRREARITSTLDWISFLWASNLRKRRSRVFMVLELWFNSLSSDSLGSRILI